MASPQLENGFSRIANEILEAMYKTRILTLNQHRFVLMILRYSYGYQLPTATLTQQKISEELGLKNYSYITRLTTELCDMNIIFKYSKRGFPTEYKFNKNYDEWTSNTPVSSLLSDDKGTTGECLTSKLPGSVVGKLPVGVLGKLPGSVAIKDIYKESNKDIYKDSNTDDDLPGNPISTTYEKLAGRLLTSRDFTALKEIEALEYFDTNKVIRAMEECNKKSNTRINGLRYFIPAIKEYLEQSKPCADRDFERIMQKGDRKF